MITRVRFYMRGSGPGSPNTPLKVWVDGVGRVKAKERLPDNTVRVMDAVSYTHLTLPTIYSV